MMCRLFCFLGENSITLTIVKTYQSMDEEKLVEEFLQRHNWEDLMKSQRMAVDVGLLDGSTNIVAIAPTASGKTGVAELAILASLTSDPPGRAMYVAPLKSLAMANLEGFRALFPESKVMSLYERRALSDADVLVGTNEFSYRNLLEKPDMIRNFNLLILDELHIMYQDRRGHTVEKLLTLAKRMGLRIICLSATIEDKQELRRWLDAAFSVSVRASHSAKNSPSVWNSSMGIAWVS